MDKTISQDRSNYHGHVFSSAQTKEQPYHQPRLPQHLPPQPPPPQPLPGQPFPRQSRPRQSRLRQRRLPQTHLQLSRPRATIGRSHSANRSINISSDEDEDETEGSVEQRLAEQLAAKLGDLIGEECSSDSATSRVMNDLVSTVSRLQVENETLKQELQDIRTSQQLATPEATEEPEEAILEGAISNLRHEPVKYVTLHHVIDSVMGEGEPLDETYLDPPRLFKGDTARDHFRGTIEVVSDKEYLEDHPEVAFAILKEYEWDEEVFHERLAEEGQYKLHRRVLRQDHPPEEPDGTKITVGSAAQSGIEAILEAFPDQFPGFQHPPDFAASEAPWLMDLRFARFKKPYLLFYLYGKKLLECLEVVEMGDLMRESLQSLCHWMEDNFSEEWREADALFAQGKVNKKHLAMLFRPGELVIRQSSPGNKLLQGGIVPWFPNNTAANGNIPVSYWTFNGSFSSSQLHAMMPWDLSSGPYFYDKIVDITSLNCYPLRFASGGIKAKFIARGQRFWECRRQKLVCYNEHGVDSLFKAEKRFMIDYAMYKRLHPQNQALQGPPRPGGMYQDHKLLQVEEPPDELLYCLPATIHGFDFATKTWETLQVDNITDVTWNKKAFSQLVAPPETKELIQAVVSAHGERKNMALDIIEGKGQGLLVLLHGGPGTGKTLTAESIAEEQERPLYRVTCGDIGTEPKEVEKYLGDVLEIGRAWGCVVLLDEADVFLEERSFSDQKRNAIISIFLRILEYYDGILILTTNRIGSFDEAFKSRIQLALGYPKLREDDRLTIWKNFVQMLHHTDDRIDMEDLNKNLYKLARVEVNGREIRNIITMARHLAKFRGQMLCYKHMQDAVRSAEKFSEYLSNVRGISDDDWAKADKLRAPMV
ncbi:AAA domain-containing protein [Fusarium sp. LHS14.1]|nr:AAA domain-containing protein [Fusarium sp. LHS14.1]